MHTNSFRLMMLRSSGGVAQRSLVRTQKAGAKISEIGELTENVSKHRPPEYHPGVLL